MAETTQNSTGTTAGGPKPPAFSRRTLRTMGRKKRNERIQKDKEFAKTYFEAKSKRSADKKSAFRKRHAKK